MKRVTWYLMVILIAISIFSADNIALSEIIVEDASYQIEFDVIPFPAFPEIPPRTVLEYASTTTVRNLIFPEYIIIEAQKVVPRTIIEYASIKYQTSLYYPYDLFQVAKSVEPRIVIEYASTIGRFRRLIAIGCFRVVSIFAMEFGRTNCSASAPCRMDFDSDGDVDGYDARELEIVVNNGTCSDLGV